MISNGNYTNSTITKACEIVNLITKHTVLTCSVIFYLSTLIIRVDINCNDDEKKPKLVNECV